MASRLLTRPEVEKKVRMSTSSIYRLVRINKFPAPVRIGIRCVRWLEDEVNDFLAERPRADGGL